MAKAKAGVVELPRVGPDDLPLPAGIRSVLARALGDEAFDADLQGFIATGQTDDLAAIRDEAAVAVTQVDVDELVVGPRTSLWLCYRPTGASGWSHTAGVQVRRF